MQKIECGRCRELPNSQKLTTQSVEEAQGFWVKCRYSSCGCKLANSLQNAGYPIPQQDFQYLSSIDRT